MVFLNAFITPRACDLHYVPKGVVHPPPSTQVDTSRKHCRRFGCRQIKRPARRRYRTEETPQGASANSRAGRLNHSAEWREDQEASCPDTKKQCPTGGSRWTFRLNQSTGSRQLSDQRRERFGAANEQHSLSGGSLPSPKHFTGASPGTKQIGTDCPSNPPRDLESQRSVRRADP